ncbi:MAG: molybdopterin molybdotransferase MoeA [Sphingomicrobium sp.]
MAAQDVTMLSLDEASAMLVADVAPVGDELVDVAQCAGRVLAADVVATRDQPGAAISAMDGFAVRDDDARSGARLRLVGNSAAGAPWSGTVEPGTAVRVATGGVVPDGTDRVLIQEIVERAGEVVTIREPPGPQSYVRLRGADFAAGETLLQSGDWLSPGRVGLAAAANHAALHVRRRPRIIILASGDELREPGSDLDVGMVVNSAAYALAALIGAWGGDVVRRPILPDELEPTIAALGRGVLDADLIVPLGGASVGERDVLRPAFAALGARILFDRVAVQPGKPTWHARFDDGRLVVGLPGNPSSAFVCAHLFVRPIIDALTARRTPTHPVHAILATAMPAGHDRETWWRGVASIDAAGLLSVTPGPRQDSNLQTPLATANALVRRGVRCDATVAGDPVEILLVGPLDA